MHFVMPPVNPEPSEIPDQSENMPSRNVENPGIQLSDSDSLSDSEIADHNGYEPLSQDPENVFINENDDEEYDSESEMEVSSTLDANNLNLVTQHDFVATSCNIPPETPIMDEEHIETIKTVMKGITLPSSNLPQWATVVPEEEWKAALLSDMQERQTKNKNENKGTFASAPTSNSQFDMAEEVLR